MTEEVTFSVVVPVYNSQDCLEELCRRIETVFAAMNSSYELILVNDGSRDASWQRIVALAKACPQVRGLSFRKNFGQDCAIMAGLRAAAGRYVVIMDDDLQHDPSDIPALAQEMASGFDVVYAQYGRKRQKLWKNLGSWFNARVAEWVLKKPRDVYLSPYKIISRGVVEEVCRYEGPYPYIDGLLFRTTSSFSRIMVEHRRRYRGTSTYSFWRSVLVWSHLATSFSVFPLRLATVLGLAAACMGVVMALVIFVHRLMYPEAAEGWASVIVSVLTLGGIQLFAIGVVGEYTGRTYLSINRQPQYVIGEATTADIEG